jgi:hypothetical protein
MPWCIKLFGKNMLNAAWATTKKRKTTKEKLLTATQKGDWNELNNILQQYLVSNALQYKLLKICIENDHMECLSLFLSNNFNPNRYHKQISPLHYAVNCDKPKAIQLLADHNADLILLVSCNNEEQTPLDRAIFLRSKQCTDILIKVMNERIKTILFSESKRCNLVKHMGIQCTCALDLKDALLKNQRNPKRS